jgi:hypothetical protein
MCPPTRGLVAALAALLGGTACDQFEDPDLAQIRSINPDSGAVGSLIVIGADNLLDNTRVIFSDEVESPVAALFLDRVATIVPDGAVSGDVVLETGGERSSSRAEFRVVPPPPLAPAFFDDDLGTAIDPAAFLGGCSNSTPDDDGWVNVVLPFSFPFYGRPQMEAFVTTNGLLTFGEPRPCDNSGRANNFANADKIAVLNLDLQLGFGGEILVNAANPETVVVTWRDMPLCRLPETSNTFQVVLFADGRIRMNFGYASTRGIGTQCFGDVVSGSLTGIAPISANNLRQVTYAAEPSVTIGPQDAVLDVFFVDRFFNLENRSLLFTPLEEGGVFAGYRVELLASE